MSTSPEFVTYLCEQLEGTGEVRSRKMFGEYMVYLNEGAKPHYVLDPDDGETLRRAAELVSQNSQPPRKRRKQT